MIQIFNRMESADYDASRFRRGQVPRNGIIGMWLRLVAAAFAEACSFDPVGIVRRGTVCRA
jgi:hypothetical protein